MIPRLIQGKPSGLVEPDDVTADTFFVSFDPERHQGIEGYRVASELPGRGFVFMTNGADVIAAIPLLVQ